MRALVVENGKALLSDVPPPVPGDGEVLIKVSMAGICSTDLEIIKGYGNFTGILGHEFVGTVAAKSGPLAGKRVVGDINCICGKCDMCASGLSNHCRKRTVLGISGRPGVFAEYVCLPQRNCVVVPDTVSDIDAVFAEPLAAAYQVLRQVKIEPRMEVAVLGTGRLGLLVAQVLQPLGCKLVAVGRNQKTLDLLDRRGIRTARFDELRQRENCDVVVECTGSPEGLPMALQMVRPRGTIVQKTTCQAPATVDLTALVVNEVTLLGSRCGPLSEALSALARNQIDTEAMVTRQMPLEHALSALELAASPDQIKVILKVAA